jgi:anti-sigma factor ChrR (cupin superfamily)
MSEQPIRIRALMRLEVKPRVATLTLGMVLRIPDHTHKSIQTTNFVKTENTNMMFCTFE